MNRPAFTIVIMIFIGFNLWSCSMSTERNVQAEKEEIRKVIDASIGWADNKDTGKLFGGVAQDASFFIFHPDSASTVVGFDRFREMVEGLFLSDAFKATGYDIRDLRINLSESGDVAWYSAILDDRGEFNGRPYAWLNTRWTGVLERRDDSWVIVQMHFSFASDAKADEKESEG